MADSSIDPDITDAITSNWNLDNLKSGLAKSLNRLLTLAITNDSHLAMPHLISLGGSPRFDPALIALLAPGTLPSLVRLIT